jgi:NAD-dependent deacetylase
LGCDRQFEKREIGWDNKRFGPGYRTQKPVAGQPVCPHCGGRLISSVVNFGDPLPAKELEAAAEHALNCDLMLVLGSSLVVNPAASLVGLAIENEARVILINQGETPYDGLVDLRIRQGIGDVLPPAVAAVRKQTSLR